MFTVYRPSGKCAILAIKKNPKPCIEKVRRSHSLPSKIIDSRTDNRGKVTKGHNINSTILRSCDIFNGQSTFPI